MKLRDYQEAAANAVIETWKTAKSCLIVLPTSCGKTVVFDEVDLGHIWLGLFENERRQLRREGKTLELRIIREGLKDPRMWAVREKLKVSGKKFRTILNFFQERFALCFQALQALRRDSKQTRFSK